MRQFLPFVLLLALRAGSLTAQPLPLEPRPAPRASSVRYSFVVLGCNRVDKADTNTALNPSTANLVQLDRTFDEVSVMQPLPSFLFFAGDMVFGYQTDTLKLERELVAWCKNWEASAAKRAGVRLVVMPGNHESQSPSKIAYENAERVWTKVMAPYIVASNGPHAGGLDSLGTDQSRLTYSFDYEDSHFVVLNTDPVGRDAHVPAHWIANDLAAARAQGARHIFAIGHKPAFAYNGNLKEGLDSTNRERFWSAMESDNADAMLSAHNHVYARLKPRGKTSMVIAGNAGSLLESSIAPDRTFFGYSVVSITTTGEAILTTYGRDLPRAGYQAPTNPRTEPTTIRDSAILGW